MQVHYEFFLKKKNFYAFLQKVVKQTKVKSHKEGESKG